MQSATEPTHHTTTIMPRKSTRAKSVNISSSKKIRRKFRELPVQYPEIISPEEEDESDGLGEFDEDMEIFAPEETEDVEVPPWWKTNATTPSLDPTKTDLLLAYVESIRYAEPRSNALKGATTPNCSSNLGYLVPFALS